MSKSRQSGKKRVWPWAVGLLAIVAVLTAIYSYNLYDTATTKVEEMHDPIQREKSKKREITVTLSERDPFSVLMLGVDAREGDSGRSDTIVVLTVNPSDETTRMVSIPRDTYTEIIGLGMMDKINHAFAFGGIEMSMETVENLLDIPIDYVVQINMDSFQEIVDAVGGVEVDNPFAFDGFPAGSQELDGEQALEYVRMRYNDPRGDFGRQDRQKQVIQGIMNKGASISSLFNYREIFDSLGNNVRTNMTFDEMVEVQRNYRNAFGTIDQYIIEYGYGETINGIWYYMMDDEELAEIQGLLQDHLDLSD